MHGDPIVMQAGEQSTTKSKPGAERVIVAFAALFGLGGAASSTAHSELLSIQPSQLEHPYCVRGGKQADDLRCMRRGLTDLRHAYDARSVSDAAINSPSRVPDWNGLERDTAYFFGLQFFVIGILYIMPENVSSWSKEDKEKYSFGKWRENVSDPVKDEDDHFINYVLHPYWGASYFVRARERGYSEWHAFGYSAALSTVYEYGAEALFEPVSAQDLIVTPVVGSLIGKFLFEDLRDRIKRKREPLGFGDRFLLVATDPLGAATVIADELLGQDAKAHLSVDLTPRGGRRVGEYLGLSLVFRW